MLYTDGEDPDQQGIHLAEGQLDSLFSDRSRHGLSQTVFVKRWSNANAELITRLSHPARYAYWTPVNRASNR